MNEIKDSQPKNIKLNIIAIVIFSLALIYYIANAYTNHFKLSYTFMIFINLYLVCLNVNYLKK